MSLTVTNYLSQINRDFPVRGQNNDAQVFRDNWQYIYDAISTANSELNSLDNSTIKINSTSTFNGNTLEDINFKNESTEIYTLDFQSGLIELDYSKGSYQKFPVLAGTHNLTVINWPEGNRSGKLVLSITAPCDEYSAINFDSSYVNLSSQLNPFELDYNSPNIFELSNEQGTGTVYIRFLTNYTYDINTSTKIISTKKLKIGTVNNNGESNTFYTGTNKATIVQRGNKFGELGLVPNRVQKSVNSANGGDPVEIILHDSTGVFPGAFLYISNLTTRFTVTQVVGNSVFIQPTVDIAEILNGDILTFINPVFDEQPTLLTLASNPTNSISGSKSNYIGSVWANKDNLEVTFDDYQDSNVNTFIVNKIVDPQDVSTVGSTLITTEFIHNLLPVGSVIMWYGSAADIPYGWTLCDGKGVVETIINGQPGPKITVPNLVNRFPIAATEDIYDPNGGKFIGPGSTILSSTATISGGSADSVVINHTHTATFYGQTLPNHNHLLNDPGHTHNNKQADQMILPRLQGGNTSNLDSNANIVVNMEGKQRPILPNVTGILIDYASGGDVSGQVEFENTGNSAGTGTNVPPFAVVYYIMKIVGDTAKNTGILN